MAGANYARTERTALCDLFDKLGPDELTLCGDWKTRDLAAHLVLRERRPLAAPGIVFRPLAGYTSRVQQAIAGREFGEIVRMLRRPPRWSPVAWGPIDRLANTGEMFIHHEDVRRAQPDWQPRSLPADLEKMLWRRASGYARLGLRRFRATVVVTAADFGTRRVGSASPGSDAPELRLAGTPGELLMFLSGRQRAARVELTGPAELTDRLFRARLGG
jgi:uncharacterized protein (TIGR03085 family)